MATQLHMDLLTVHMDDFSLDDFLKVCIHYVFGQL